MNHSPVDFAWQIHAALDQWTGRVDAKASFALTINSALLGAAIAASDGSRPLGSIVGELATWIYRAGVALLILAIILAALAVLPHLRGWAARKASGSNYIYFGHLRHWDPVALEEALRERDPLPVLARQHVAMARIAWRKHRLVQGSFWSALLGSLALGGMAWKAIVS